MVKSKFLLPVLIIFLFACTQGKNQSGEPVSGPIKVEANGYIVPKDSLSSPETVPAGKPITVKVGKLAETQETSNIHPAKKPEIFTPSEPAIKVYIGSKQGLQGSVVAIGKTVFCKAPEMVLVKEPYVRDINPLNFSNFSKLQGLRHDQLRSIIQDKMGNIWLGTDDGLTKYDGKYFFHYTTDQGLNNNLILSLFHDSKGNIWFGTFRGGVTKYDGRYLTNFSTEGGLINDVVNCIYEDKEGNFWFGTGGGAVKYDGKNFTNYTVNEGLSNNDVRSIIQDNSGNLWIGTNGGGFSVFNGKTFVNYTDKEESALNNISTFFNDKDGNIWVGTASRGILKFDGSTYVHYTTENGLCSNSIRTITQDSEGNMWVGTTDGGVSEFDGKFFINYSLTAGLNSNYIRSILQDSYGNMWFGTRGAGLTRFDGDIFTHYTENEGLSNSRVMNILEDKSGTLWLGTFGGYVTKCTTREIDGVKTRFFSQFGKDQGLLSSRTYSLIQDRSGNIWFGTDGGGVSMFDGKVTVTFTKEQGLCDNAIRKIYEDRDGNLWFASYGSGISKFNGTSFTNFSKEDGINSNSVLSILQDKKGNIWFGTDGGGVTCFDGKNYIQYTKKQGFFSNTVYSIIEDENGILWFGTGGEGLVRYDGKTFVKYAEESGLNNNHVLSLFQDSNKNIWAGTRFGINILKAEKLKHIQNSTDGLLFKSYNYEDGFIGIGCNLGAITEDKDGTVWIGTNDRLTAFHGERKKNGPVTPNLQITNIQLYNENIPWTELAENQDTSLLLHNGVTVGKFKFTGISQWNGIPENLKLSHKDNYITFNFTEIAQTQIRKIRYQYKLDGLDKNWNYPTDRTEVSYGNLSSGKYAFRVKAINSEGVWSNEVSYEFSILPPWWATWWFYLLLAVFAILSIYSFVKYRERQLTHDKQQLEAKVREQTHELTDKNKELEVINLEKDKLFSIIAHDLRGPFSTFLGLTQIMSEELTSFTMDEIKEFAVSMNTSATNLFSLLENLLQWSRMQQSAVPFNPKPVNLISLLEENMALPLQAAKEKGIELTYDIPDGINFNADSNMLQTIIRNLVSNAIKFTDKGGKVVLSAKTCNDKNIEISVKDNGIGMSEAVINNLFHLNEETNRPGTAGEPSSGLGLMICKGLIEKHGGELRVESEVGKGSAFYFTIPQNV